MNPKMWKSSSKKKRRWGGKQHHEERLGKLSPIRLEKFSRKAARALENCARVARDVSLRKQIHRETRHYLRSGKGTVELLVREKHKENDRSVDIEVTRFALADGVKKNGPRRFYFSVRLEPKKMDKKTRARVGVRSMRLWNLFGIALTFVVGSTLAAPRPRASSCFYFQSALFSFFQVFRRCASSLLVNHWTKSLLAGL